MDGISTNGLGACARDLRAEDLAECLSINPARLGDELIGRARAVEIWKSLIASRSFNAAVIEVPRPVAGHSIVGFGAAVFVKTSFADEELSNPRPGLNARVLASIDSDRSVVLSERELRSANTHEGLDSLILYGSRREELTPDGVTEVATAMAYRYLENHRGYRLNRMITETAGEAEMTMYLEATHAWQVVRHFGGADNGSRSLWVCTREQSLTIKASFVNFIFQYTEPVLRLREADQRLLLAALGGLTDEELSCKLGLSLTAIKKRWISIFERSVDVRPDLFPGFASNDGEKRGRQKRHHVLAYVRSHPEELRPIDT